MIEPDPKSRPLLVPHARYRWDAIRSQHQIVFPEGLLVLNETAAAILRLLDGRSVEEVLAALEATFDGGVERSDVSAFISELTGKGLLRHDSRA